MALYTGYFDESGHETSDYLVCGGLALDIENLASFEDDWREAIRPLKYLHTTDFVAGDKDFNSWKNKGLDDKRELLIRAAKVIGKHACQTFSSTLIMEDYRRVNEETMFSEVVAHPFSLCARFASVQVQQWATANKIDGRIKMVFENRSEGESEVKAVFARDELPEPAFEKKSVCPLQAADLIAWTNQGKMARSANFQRVGKSVQAELVATLHVRDVIEYRAMRRMLRLGSSGRDLKREATKATVAFHTNPKGTRTRFKKRGHAALGLSIYRANPH